MAQNDNIENEDVNVETVEQIPRRRSTDSINGFMQDNRRMLVYGGGGLLAIVALIFGYKYFISDPMELEAEAKVHQAEAYYGMDSVNLALKGDGMHSGLKEVADDYPGTKAGKRAAYYLGMNLLNTGKFDEAIEYLENYDLGDKIVQPLAIGAIGDCYSEKNELEKAASYYLKAAESSKLDFPAPRFYKKAGVVYEQLKDYDKALSVYETIQKEHPKSQEAYEMDKYIARAKTMLGKEEE